jgi:uncharacterized protein with HEPN domain
LSSRPDDLYLVDIIEASERIAAMVAEHDLKSFEADDVLTSAVQYQLMVVGEACGRIQEATSNVMVDAPIPQIRGFRNRIVHGYFAVDLAIVWEVATVHVPTLARSAEAALESLFPATFVLLQLGQTRTDERSV